MLRECFFGAKLSRAHRSKTPFFHGLFCTRHQSINFSMPCYSQSKDNPIYITLNDQNCHHSIVILASLLLGLHRLENGIPWFFFFSGSVQFHESMLAARFQAFQTKHSPPPYDEQRTHSHETKIKSSRECYCTGRCYPTSPGQIQFLIKSYL